MTQPRDPAYPELKKSHTMARKGRPFTDYKPPAAAPVWAVIEGLGRYHILLAALELRVFEELAELPSEITRIATAKPPYPDTQQPKHTNPTNTTAPPHPSSKTTQPQQTEHTNPAGATADELAEQLNVSPCHLESLLDSLVALGFIDRIAGDTIRGIGAYELNDTARRYLLDDGPASMTGLIPVAPGPHANWTQLARTVTYGRPATPIDDHPASFYRPLVEGTFTTMWRCATRADLQVRYSALTAPRVLDLGAGGAPWSIAMLEACAQGGAVINDLEDVIGFARRKTAEHGVDDRCEFRPGDFHTVRLEPEHYDIVVLGHVCRTEGPAGARHLVERAFAALRPEGRLLLADYFIPPDHKSSPHTTLMGMTMMASTVNGFPVTTEAACQWLRDTGFKAIRLIEPIGFQFVYVATKPRKPHHTKRPQP